MMMLLALPQPGPRLASAPRADAAWSSSIEPRPRPSRPEPPTRRMSRRVTPSCGSHRSFPACPGYDDHRVAPWSSPRGLGPSPSRAAPHAYQTNIVSRRTGLVLRKMRFFRRPAANDYYPGVPLSVMPITTDHVNSGLGVLTSTPSRVGILVSSEVDHSVQSWPIACKCWKLVSMWNRIVAAAASGSRAATAARMAAWCQCASFAP